MEDANYIRKPVSEWTTETIRQWMYIIAERSDRLISSAMETDDWDEYNDDDKMYTKLSTELNRRGEKP
jgi:hypothetical protein